MLIEDGLVVADAYLDRTRLHLDRVHPTLTTPSVVGDEALHRFSVPKQLRRASVGLERARAYLHAAKEAIGDVADDIAHGATARAVEDLRLLERLCAMADELSGQAARQLAVTSQDPSTAEERGRDLAVVRSRIDQARSSAQAAGRLAGELAAGYRPSAPERAEPVVLRLRAEQRSRRPTSLTASAIGVPR